MVLGVTCRLHSSVCFLCVTSVVRSFHGGLFVDCSVCGCLQVAVNILIRISVLLTAKILPPVN